MPENLMTILLYVYKLSGGIGVPPPSGAKKNHPFLEAIQANFDIDFQKHCFVPENW